MAQLPLQHCPQSDSLHYLKQSAAASHWTDCHRSSGWPQASSEFSAVNDKLESSDKIRTLYFVSSRDKCAKRTKISIQDINQDGWIKLNEQEWDRSKHLMFCPDNKGIFRSSSKGKIFTSELGYFCSTEQYTLYLDYVKLRKFAFGSACFGSDWNNKNILMGAIRLCY